MIRKKFKLESTQLDILLLLIFSSIYFFIFLGTRHLSIPDEGRYPEIAREMLSSNNWITPKINGIPFLEKPILYYWIEVLFMKFFGINTWAIRAPIAIFGIFGITCLYSFGRVLYTRRVAILASCILATSPIYFLSAHYANMDLIVANLLWISFFFVVLALKQSRRNKNTRISMYCAYTFASLACLTKGLMGVAFPIMVIGIWIIFTNNWRSLKKLHIMEGFLIICILISPWLYLVIKENPDFLYFYFYYQQIYRFIGTGFNNAFGPWFYITVIMVGILPWSIAIFPAIGKIIKTLNNIQYANSSIVLLLIWTISVFIFFSIPKSKIIGYILPIIAPLSLLIAFYFERLRQEKSIILRVLLCLINIITIQMSVALIFYPLYHKPYNLFLCKLFIISGVILLLISTSSAIFNYKKNLSVCIILTIFYMAIFNITALVSVPIFDKKTSKPLVEAVVPLIRKDSVIVSYETYKEDLPLLLQRKIFITHEWNKDISKSADNWAREFMYGIQQYKSNHKIKSPKYFITKNDFYNIWKNKKSIFVFSTIEHYKNLKKILIPKPKLIAIKNSNVVFMK